MSSSKRLLPDRRTVVRWGVPVGIICLVIVLALIQLNPGNTIIVRVSLLIMI